MYYSFAQGRLKTMRNAITVRGISILVLSLSTTLSTAQERLPVNEVVTAVQGNIKGRCDQLTTLAQVIGRSDSPNAGIIRSQQVIMCQCMPKKVEAIRESYPSDAQVTQDEFLSKAKVAFDSCAADLFRETHAKQCNTSANKKVRSSERRGYCKCAAEKLAGVSDESIVKAQEKARVDFDAKVQAKENGQPPPTIEPSEIDSALMNCKPAK
jgi:hypothetical protein